MDENKELDNIITLEDENGEEVSCEWLDTESYKGDDYAVMLILEGDEPDAEDASEDVVIMRIVPDEENEEEISFETVEDEDVLDAVFEQFSRRVEEMDN